ncbi:MAG: hypothetical protein ACXAC5_00495 [Promethearchaeota archaeon]
MKMHCSNCDSEVDKSPCYVKRNKTGLFFCNNSCKSKHYRKSYSVKCVVCGTDFEKVPAEQKRYPIHCCSVECRSKYNDKRETRHCSECGKKVCRPPSVLKDRDNVFCSVKCHDVFQDLREEVKCDKCGINFQKQLSLIKRSNYNFCSTSCFSKYTFNDSYVEREFERLVKDLEIKFVRNDRGVLRDPNESDGRKCLELDFYFPTIKFAVEVNGSCHYEPIYGEDALAAQKVRDRKKRRACKERGIILRVVKPGDCKRETYMPRYKRVIWEIEKRRFPKSKPIA